MFSAHFWIFIARTRKWTLLLAALFVIGTILLLLFFPAKAKTITQQWDNIQVWLGALTLFVACSVWLSEAQQEWRNNLPKRLSIDFKLVSGVQEDGEQVEEQNDRTLMRCNRAKLIGEGDIRALAQQIGRQMVNNYHGGQSKSKQHTDLNMIPMLDEVSEKIDFKRKEKHYKVTVKLTSVPDCLSAIPKDKILFWEDDFTMLPQLKIYKNENS